MVACTGLVTCLAKREPARYLGHFRVAEDAGGAARLNPRHARGVRRFDLPNAARFAADRASPRKLATITAQVPVDAHFAQNARRPITGRRPIKESATIRSSGWPLGHIIEPGISR
jgi:hypothetical protein